jgi:hypothetical protein
VNIKEGTDFKLDSQYDGNTGKVGVEFMSTEAAEKYAQVASKIKNPPPAPSAPVATAPQPTTAAVVSTAPTNANTQTAESQMPTSNSAGGTAQNQLNNTNTQVAALRTESETLDRLILNNNENATRIINKLESLTASIQMSIPTTG